MKNNKITRNIITRNIITRNIITRNKMSNDLENDKYDINNYFDKIFVINLKRREDRKKAMIYKLEKAGITNYEFIEAIDGNSQPYLNIYRIKKRLNQFTETQGALGILYSALKVLLTAKLRKYNKILILEDDVYFYKDFINQFKERIKRIPEWKLLYFGTSMSEWRFKERCQINKVNKYLTSKGTITGAFSIGIDCSIFNELINYIKTSIKPWDLEPLRIINQIYNSRVIVFYPYLVICQTNNSDIRGNQGNNEKKTKYGWNYKEFDIYD